MKQAVEAGLRIFLGQRLRVSLSDCSTERLAHMLEQIDRELNRLRSELIEAEAKVLELYASTENVSLEYCSGQYQFPLDQYREQLIELRNRIEELFEKRKPVYKAYQEKYLLVRQAKLLGGESMVCLKDRLIFSLIFVVLILLGVDAGNLGASGSGAKLQPVVDSEGRVTEVIVIEGGRAYQAARGYAVAQADAAGRGLEMILNVSDRGAVTDAQILSGGAGYKQSLTLAAEPALSAQRLHQFWLIDFICCLFFLGNFFFELVLSSSKKWYWKTHWIDFITSIPLPPAQMLAGLGLSGSEVVRAGRVTRVIRLLRALRAMRIFLLMWRGLDHFTELFDVRLMKKSFGVGIAVLLAGALLITLFGEKGDGYEAVDGFMPGLWWSFTTLVTGGFGDIYNPQTLAGRILTVFLVLSGMVLVGVFTATLTTILVGKEERAQAAMQNEVLDKIQQEGHRTEQAITRVEQRQKKIGGRLTEMEEQIRELQNPDA